MCPSRICFLVSSSTWASALPLGSVCSAHYAFKWPRCMWEVGRVAGHGFIPGFDFALVFCFGEFRQYDVWFSGVLETITEQLNQLW